MHVTDTRVCNCNVCSKMHARRKTRESAENENNSGKKNFGNLQQENVFQRLIVQVTSGKIV